MSINSVYQQMLQHKSIIRELSEYATKRGEQIGKENVFDFSLGNPSIPTPVEYTNAMIELHQEMDPVLLHSYSPSLGLPSVRSAIAAYLKKTYAIPYEARHIFMVSGAASALAHAIRAVVSPGEEIILFALYFPEYFPYIEHTGAKIRVVDADPETFQIQFEQFEKMLNPQVAAVLINTPNNPSGVTYSRETLSRLAHILKEKEREWNRPIFLVSDEPYRELVFSHAEAPYVSDFYSNTLVCYSYSKSLSLPGERIGYIAVHPNGVASDELVGIFAQISRTIGHNCPASSVQLALEKVLDVHVPVDVYEENALLLYETFKHLGFEVVKPTGTFYVFPKALEDDAVAFCMKAKEYDLIFVPSDSFGVRGHFRVAYCMPTEKVKRSIPVIERFVKEVYGTK